SRRGDPHEVVLVRPAECPARHHLAPYGHHILKGKMYVREGGAHDSHNLFDVLRPAAEIVARGVVADVGGADEFVRDREVPAIDDFFKIPADDGFVSCGHGSFLPARRGFTPFPGIPLSSSAARPAPASTRSSPRPMCRPDPRRSR